MKVFFSHPKLGGNLHSAYQELLNNPPSGVEYVSNSQAKFQQAVSKSSILKSIARKINIPTILNVNTDCPLIHAVQHLVLNNKPWVVDVEHIGTFSGMDPKRERGAVSKFLVRKFLEKKQCKQILPWTFAAKEGMDNLLKSKIIQEKTTVLHAAVHSVDFHKPKSDQVNFFFVSKFFQRKGGYEAIEAFRKIEDKYDNIKMTVVSEIDMPIDKTKYHKIEFSNPVPRAELYEKYFKTSDVFVYPTFYDTFGLVMLEAMSFGMPVITIDDFPTKEIVENGVNGFLVDGYSQRWYDKDKLHDVQNHKLDNLIKSHTTQEQQRIINDLSEKMCVLIEDSKLRENMSKNCLSMINGGKFSIAERNKKLKEVYESALRA
jgi:glycosyltransferase involved in cell wall biosynthesis